MSAPQSKILVLEFEYISSFCPMELGISEDVRELAVGFIEIVVSDPEDEQIVGVFDFRNGVPSNANALFGFSGGEGWGTWSDGKRSALRLELATSAANVRVDIRHAIYPDLVIPADVIVNRAAPVRLEFAGGVTTCVVDTDRMWKGPNPPHNKSQSSDDEIDLSIIIVSDDDVDLAYMLVSNILSARATRDYEVIVFENGLSEDSRSRLRSIGLPVRVLEHGTALPQVSAHNLAAESARGRFLVFLRNDAFVVGESLDRLAAALEDETIGAVGPTLLGPDDAVRGLGGFINVDGSTTSQCANQSFDALSSLVAVDFVPRECLAIRRCDFLGLAGFDPFADQAGADFALRLRAAGKRSYLLRYAAVRFTKPVSSFELKPQVATGAMEALRARWSRWLASRRDDSLPVRDFLGLNDWARQHAGFPDEVVHCVSSSDGARQGLAHYSFLAVSAALGQSRPTLVCNPTIISHTEMCGLAATLDLPSERLAIATQAGIATRNVDIHVFSSRSFPCIAPAVGQIRILHCPMPEPLNENDVKDTQRRVGGFLNFDAVVTDSESARRACRAILERIDAPDVPIHVIPPPSLGHDGAVEKGNLLVSLGPLRGAPDGGVHERVLHALRVLRKEGSAAGWAIVMAGDFDPEQDFRYLNRLRTIASTLESHVLVNPTPAVFRQLFARAKICVATGPSAFQSETKSAMEAGCIPVVPMGSLAAETSSSCPGTVIFDDIDDLVPAIREAVHQSGRPWQRETTVMSDLQRYLDDWARLRHDVDVATPRLAIERPAAFVVIGMHRSGTSAMARILALAGAELPNDLMPPKRDNPRGYWEPLNISHYNDALLSDLGSSWDDAFAYSAAYRGSFSASLEEEGRPTLRAGYSGHRPIVLKDPRLSLLEKVWYRILCDEGYEPAYIIMVRNPLDVAKSLMKRNGFSFSRGLLLWSSYMISCVRETVGKPRMFVTYADLLADPNSILDRVTTHWPGVLPRASTCREAVRHFVDPRLQNHATGPTTLPDAFAPVGLLFEALKTADENPQGLVQAAEDTYRWLEGLRMIMQDDAMTIPTG